MLRKSVSLLILVLLVVTLAAGCGAKATPTPVPPTAVPPTAVPPTPVPPTPVPPTPVPPTPVPPTAVPPTAVPTIAVRPTADPIRLTLSGPDASMTLGTPDLAKMKIVSVPYTGKDGVTTVYQGVTFDDILKVAGVSGRRDLTLVASDGAIYDLPAADFAGCADCIVALDPAGGLRSVLPKLGGKAQLRGLVEIQLRGAAEVPASAIPADAALKVTGKVSKPIGWNEAAVKAMKTLEVQSTNNKGETSTYTGVLLKDLIALAGPAADAKTVVFVASDGFTAEIGLADLMACGNCIASFRSQGGFSTVLPGQPGSLQVKGVVEIQIK